MRNKFSPADLERIADRWSRFTVPDALSDPTAYASKVYDQSFEYYLKRVAMLGADGTHALDVGCGCGQWSFALASKFDHVTGIDYTTPRIDLSTYLAREFEIDRVSFRESGAVPLDFASASFDFVVCYGVIVSYLSLPACLNEFFRVLKPGGRFYICLNGPEWARHVRDVLSTTEARYRKSGIETCYNSICQYHFGGQTEAFRNLRHMFLIHPEMLDKHCAKHGGDGQQVRQALTQVRTCPLKDTALLTDLSQAYISALDARGGDRFDALDRIEQLFAAMSVSLDLQTAGREIELECGPDYIQTFVNDLVLILAGRPYAFSYSSSGRVYRVDEVRKAVAAAGFEDFVYADEGCLRCDPEAEMVEPVYPRVSDEQKVWEFMARKPTTTANRLESS